MGDVANEINPSRARSNRPMQAVIFFVFAVFAFGGAIGMVVARNPVHSALLLVVTLVSVAVFFLQEEAFNPEKDLFLRDLAQL